MTPEILAVIGGLIAVILAVNAYFVKELVESINQVKVQTATLLEKSLNNEDEIQLLRMRMHDLTNELSGKIMKIEIELVKLNKQEK